MELKQFTAKSLEQLRREQKAIAEKAIAPQTVTELPEWYAAKLRESERKATAQFIPLSKEDTKRLFWAALEKTAENAKRTATVDDHNRQLFRIITGWLCGDQFGDFDPSKGIALLGSVGSGKTFTMRAVQRFMILSNDPRQFKLNVCADIYGEAVGDISTMRTYEKDARCFDDLGQESPVFKSYGNEIDVMAAILSARHRRYEGSGELTHITSNLTLDEIETRYGSRVADRLVQMCNIYELGGASRRK